MNRAALGRVRSSWRPLSPRQQMDGKRELCRGASGQLHKSSTGFYARIYAVSGQSTNADTASRITELPRCDFRLYEKLPLCEVFPNLSQMTIFTNVLSST